MCMYFVLVYYYTTGDNHVTLIMIGEVKVSDDGLHLASKWFSKVS